MKQSAFFPGLETPSTSSVPPLLSGPGDPEHELGSSRFELLSGPGDPEHELGSSRFEVP